MRVDCYVFGYGSLIHPGSVSRTLRCRINAADMWSAELHGYQRSWQVVVARRFMDGPSTEPVTCVVLDIVARAGRSMNGVLIPVTPTQLRALEVREARYDRIDVTDAIEADDVQVDRPVFTFRGKPEHTSPPSSAVIAGQYHDLVLAGCRLRGEDFVARFNESTLPTPWPIQPGRWDYPNQPLRAANRT